MGGTVLVLLLHHEGHEGIEKVMYQTPFFVAFVLFVVNN
jgi:hypothetical protein